MSPFPGWPTGSGYLLFDKQLPEKGLVMSFRAKRGISLFLRVNLGEIPRFARNEKMERAFRKLDRLRLAFAGCLGYPIRDNGNANFFAAAHR
jgi:hypothetical protein